MNPIPPENPALFAPERLRQLRAKNQFTLQALADKVGVSHTQIAHFENGRRLPTPKQIHALARALDVRPEDLASGSRVAVLERLHPLPPSVLERDVRLLDALVAEALDTAVRLESWVSALPIGAPEVGTIPLCEVHEAEELAEAIRDGFGFGRQAIHDLSGGLEGIGMVLVELDAPASFRAALYRAEVPGERLVMAVGTRLSATEKRLAMAEVIGRTLVRPTRLLRLSLAQWRRARLRSRMVCAYDEPPSEVGRVHFEATVQRFGRAFLAPRTCVRSVLGRDEEVTPLPVTPEEALLVAYHFGLSTDAALLRLHDLGFVDADGLRQLRRRPLPDPPETRTERPRAVLRAMLDERLLRP